VKDLNYILKQVNSFVNHIQSEYGETSHLGKVAKLSQSELVALLKGNLRNKPHVNTFKTAIKYAIKRFKLNKNVKWNKCQCVVFINSLSQLKSNKSTIQELKQNGISVVVLTTKESLIKELRPLQIPVVYGMGIWPFPVSNQSAQLEGIEAEMMKYLRKSIRKYKHLLPFFWRFIKQSNAKYALIGNDYTFEGGVFRECCKTLGIRTGSIQHGSMDHTNPLHATIRVDDLYVWGEITINSLRKLGVKNTNIQIVGRPSMESSDISKDVEPAFKKPYVLIGTSGIGVLTSKEHHLKKIQILSQLAQEIPSLHWVFKLHPKDSKEYYANVPSNAVVVNNADLKTDGYNNEDVLANCSFVVSGGSTFTLDALQLGKVVITLDLMGEYTSVPFVEEGITEYVTNKETLRNKVKELSENELYVLDGRRLNRFIFGLVNPQHKAEELIARKIMKELF
jgi:hypothetical protein